MDYYKITSRSFQNSTKSARGGYYRIGLTDLVLLAYAYGTTGTPPSSVPINGLPGNPRTWNPAVDLASPAGYIGDPDLTTLGIEWGWYYGNWTTALGQSLPTAWPATEPNPP